MHSLSPLHVEGFQRLAVMNPCQGGPGAPSGVHAQSDESRVECKRDPSSSTTAGTVGRRRIG